MFSPGIKLIGNVTIAVVLTYGGYRALHGQIEVGVLAAFLLYLRRFFEPMQELSQFYNSLQSATAALEKLSGVLQEQPGRTRAGPPARRLPGRAPAARSTSTGVTLRLPAPTGSCCPSWTCSIPAGQTVALVGATGAGKSTVAKLVARFYDPVARHGPARRGRPARPVSDDDLRRAVVMVTQENFLFSGTIAENIAFGRPDATPGRDRGGGRGDRRGRRSSAACPTATTPTSASAAGGSRPASASWSRSPAPSWPTRRC